VNTLMMVQSPSLRRSGFGREHPFADLGVHSILTVEIPSRGMTGTGWLQPKNACYFISLRIAWRIWSGWYAAPN